MSGGLLVFGALRMEVAVEATRLPRVNEVLTGERVAYRAGGACLPALTAARLGAPVAMAGAVGSDSFGEGLLADLDREGVDTSQVARVEGCTGMSVAIDGTESGQHEAVIVPGVSCAPVDAMVPEGVDHVFLQNDMPGAANLDLARAAKAVGAKVIWNAAPAQAKDSDLLALCDVLIVSRSQATEITRERSVKGLIEGLGELGVPLAVLMLGTGGTVVVEGRMSEHFAAHNPDAAPKHGASAVFCGAFAASLVAGHGTSAAMKQASAALACHVTGRPVSAENLRPGS